MNDPKWCRAKIDELDDLLSRHIHFNDQVNNELEEIRIVWSDAAARIIFNRYLDPCRLDIIETQSHLIAHLARVREVVALMEEAESPGEEIMRFLEMTLELRKRTDNELSTGHHCVDLALDESNVAEELTKHAMRVLNSI